MDQKASAFGRMSLTVMLNVYMTVTSTNKALGAAASIAMVLLMAATSGALHPKFQIGRTRREEEQTIATSPKTSAPPPPEIGSTDFLRFLMDTAAIHHDTAEPPCKPVFQAYAGRRQPKYQA